MAEPPAAAHNDPGEHLGARLREARLQANLSLREVARQLGVSASFVSQLENGKSQPSVATLYSWTRLLGVSVDRLFGAADDGLPVPPTPSHGRLEEHPTAPASSADDATGAGGTQALPAASWPGHTPRQLRLSVTTPGHRSRLVLDSGVVWEQLVRKSDDLDFIELTYPAGSSSTMDGRMLRHDDYEYGILLEGELEVTLGFDVFVLRAGEAVGFDSTIPHLFRNPGTTPARGIWVMHHRHS